MKETIVRTALSLLLWGCALQAADLTIYFVDVEG
jgi:hypothetical protein